jgi:hypothetical protein
MLREISEDVRVRLKDRLRDLRSMVRERRHDHARVAGPLAETRDQSFPVREIEGILGHAVSAFDDVMTLAERFAPSRSPGGSMVFAPQPLQEYFRLQPDAGLDGARAFRRDLYRLAKLALQQKHLAGFRIRESDFASVHDALEKNDASSIARLHSEMGEERLPLVAGLTARLFVELVRHEPIRLAATTDQQVPERSAAAVNSLAAIAIACGLATLDLEGAPGRELMEVATLAVDVRGERIGAALDMDRFDELNRLFEGLLAHLN